MRVVAGLARGRKLKTLEGLEVRPTTDRVKEAMFSILQAEIPGATVLDLFSGSGQLGIEALSRGAKRCIFVDSSRESIATTKENLKTTGLFEKSVVITSDSIAYLKSCSERFDIVLLDPPYKSSLIEKALDFIPSILSSTGVVLCETTADYSFSENIKKLSLKKEYRYGKIKLAIYRMEEV